MTASDIQSVLQPAGVQAAHIERLWWVMFWVSAGVFVALMTGLGVAVARGRRGAAVEASPRTMARGVAASVAVSTLALIGLLVASVMTGRALGSMPGADALEIRLTGYQWWWGVEYLNRTPSLRATTANELHLPVGRTVALRLQSTDVIHSFWVPNLHGKTDLIPGRENVIRLRADRPGVFRGQCAEYCGTQHAHMALTIVAEPSDAFEAWLSAQRAPAPEPTSGDATRGRAVFAQGPCAMCHAVQGTAAGGRTAPDLTHFASRSTIGAGTVPNTPDQLAQWIANPQHMKPGNRMPATGLSDEDLHAVVAYLETLR